MDRPKTGLLSNDIILYQRISISRIYHIFPNIFFLLWGTMEKVYLEGNKEDIELTCLSC